MDGNEKLDQIAELLDHNGSSLTRETRLDEIGWDSMGMLCVVALAKQNGRTVTGAQTRAFETVGDILDAVF